MKSPSEPLAATVDVRGMFDRIAPRYDLANRVMSAGIDLYWRKKAMKDLLPGLPERPVILDLGAGTLDGTVEIIKHKPAARVAAVDFAREMLQAGQRKLSGTHAAVASHAADGHNLPFRDNAFDAAFSAFCVRNIARLDVGLAELRRVCKPGATVVILDFFKPTSTRWFFDKVWNAKALPLMGWAITGDRRAYQYLPASIDAFDTTERFTQRLGTAGFCDVRTVNLFPSTIASLIVAR